MLMKSLWWGPFLNEPDGGAIINHYLLKQLNYLRPNHEFHGIPKMPQLLDNEVLPFMRFKSVKYEAGQLQGNKHLLKEIPEYMIQNNIPLLSMFHVPWTFFPIVKAIQKIGKKTLIHQTVHWTTDMIFKSRVLQDVDSWIAPTRWGKEQLITVGKIDKEKIKYIPHAVNVEDFYPHNTLFRQSLNLKPNQKVVLVVGRCSLAKGLHQVIPIMRNLVRDYDVVFIIKAGIYERVAKSQEIGYIIKMLAKNIPNIIWLPKWTMPEFMEELIASCDILLQPSGHEGFDVPLIEAMACRKPIAVSNIPNHYEIMGQRNRYCGIFMEPSVRAEIINDGKQVIKVPSSDVIEGTLRFMLENPDECKTMGQNGYTRVREYYNLEKIGKKWLEYMDGLF